VTYQWVRSDGSSSAPATVRVGPGAQAKVNDDRPLLVAVAGDPDFVYTGQPDIVASPGGHYLFTDTLQVTSPYRVSASYSYAYSCTYLPLRVTTTALPGAVNGSGYNATLSAAGGDGHYRWSATGLPSGLSLNPDTGASTGTPNVQIGPGSNTVSFNVFITVADGEQPAQQTERPFSFTVAA
jgi:hypothetical protein